MEDYDFADLQAAAQAEFCVGKDVSYQLLVGSEATRVRAGTPKADTIEGCIEEVWELVNSDPSVLEHRAPGLAPDDEPENHPLHPVGLTREERAHGFRLVKFPRPENYSLPMGMAQPSTWIRVAVLQVSEGRRAVKHRPGEAQPSCYAIWDDDGKVAEPPAHSLDELRSRFGG